MHTGNVNKNGWTREKADALLDEITRPAEPPMVKRSGMHPAMLAAIIVLGVGGGIVLGVFALLVYVAMYVGK